MKRFPVAATAFLLVPALGCGEGSSRESTAASRDSAGIRIVESTDPVWTEGAAWRVAAEPALHIGADAGEPAHQLYQVSDAVRLSDGRVVVADAGSHELRYFDATGTHLMSVGRQGGGPGEFQAIMAAQALPGDSVLAYDGMQRRYTVFGPDGRHARDVSLMVDQPLLFLFSIHRMPDGSLVAQAPSRVPGPEMLNRPTGRQRDSVLVLRLTPTGAVQDTIGIFPNFVVNVTHVEMGGRQFPMPMPVPFTGRTAIAIGGGQIYIGTTDTYEIRSFGAGGALRRLIRHAQDPRAVTPDDIERVRTQFAKQLEAPSAAPFASALRDAYEGAEFPEFMPAYADIMADPAGNLWVGETGRPEAPQRWAVFDPGGTMLGSLELPEGFRVTEIGEDYVLGIVVDELEVETVVLYRLVKPAPR